jgi:phosphodiesterase/alkaline phosphatase D-like protein
MVGESPRKPVQSAGINEKRGRRSGRRLRVASRATLDSGAASLKSWARTGCLMSNNGTRKRALLACQCLTILAVSCFAPALPAATYPPNAVALTNGPAADKISRTSAVIWWDTDVNSSSLVRYGTTMTDMQQQLRRPGSSCKHEIRLENLQPNTTYYFYIQSGGKGRGTAVSDVGVFKTRP